MRSVSKHFVSSPGSPQKLLGALAIIFLAAAAAGAGVTGPTVLAPLSGYIEAEALEISDSGHAVGSSADFSYSYPYYRFEYVPTIWDRQGTPTLLPLPAGCPTPVFATGPTGDAESINNMGEAVGFCFFQFSFDTHGVRWDKNGNPTLLTPLAGDDSTLPFQINETGTSAGFSLDTAVGTASLKAVLWDSAGTPTGLPPLAGDLVAIARDVNNNGVAVGKSGQFSVAPGIETAVAWDRNGFPTALPPLPGFGHSSGWRVNERGEFLGVSYDQAGPATATKWDRNGNPTALGFLPGDFNARTWGFNDVGRATGLSIPSLSAIFWDASGTSTAVPPLAGDFFSHAHGLNNRGQVVGGSLGPTGTGFFQATIWKVTNGKVAAASDRTLTRRELRQRKKALRKWERKNAGSVRGAAQQHRSDLVGN